MQELTENVSFLKSVICMLAEENYKTEVKDCGMEDTIIGPGLEFESKEEYMRTTIQEWFEEVQDTIKIFKKKEEEITPNFRIISNGFHLLKLGETFQLDINSELMRVPGGWIFRRISTNDDFLVFIPYSNEFKL